ncbi:MAG: CoA ester lyase [Pseudomonadota bacterium]
MVESMRPLRSVLYIPASKQRALEKARGLKADAIIFDLEDAVSPTEKIAARHTLSAALAEGGYGDRLRIVRINGLDTPWGREDAALAQACDAVLVPKVGAAADVSAAASLTGDTPLWAMIETPQGVLNAADIAQAPGMAGFVMGTNDLAKDLGARVGPDRVELMQSLQMALLAARMAGIPCIDGVFNAFKDEDGLRRECQQGRDLGMDGKTLIHPAQIDIANAVFAPDDDEVTLARRQISAFDEATARGEGVAVVDGRIVENLHVETARKVLARADAIARLEAA